VYAGHYLAMTFSLSFAVMR